MDLYEITPREALDLLPKNWKLSNATARQDSFTYPLGGHSHSSWSRHQSRWDEAEKLESAGETLKTKLGADHPSTRTVAREVRSIV